MPESDSTVRINVVVDISTRSLQTIVHQAKTMAGRNEKGYYQVDTADKVGELISRFLKEMDFDTYAENPEKYDAM